MIQRRKFTCDAYADSIGTKLCGKPAIAWNWEGRYEGDAAFPRLRREQPRAEFPSQLFFSCCHAHALYGPSSHDYPLDTLRRGYGRWECKWPDGSWHEVCEPTPEEISQFEIEDRLANAS